VGWAGRVKKQGRGGGAEEGARARGRGSGAGSAGHGARWHAWRWRLRTGKRWCRNFRCTSCTPRCLVSGRSNRCSRMRTGRPRTFWQRRKSRTSRCFCSPRTCRIDMPDSCRRGLRVADTKQPRDKLSQEEGWGSASGRRAGAARAGRRPAGLPSFNVGALGWHRLAAALPEPKGCVPACRDPRRHPYLFGTGIACSKGAPGPSQRRQSYWWSI